MNASYLSDRAFAEENEGPIALDRYGKPIGRDPSPEQIRRRAAAIRDSWSEREEYVRRTFHHPDDRGEHIEPAWEVPLVKEPSGFVA